MMFIQSTDRCWRDTSDESVVMARLSPEIFSHLNVGKGGPPVGSYNFRAHTSAHEA